MPVPFQLDENVFKEELEHLKSKNLLREPLTFEQSDGRTVTQNGKKYLLFCSNDYLGLSQDGRIVEAVREGLLRYGFGSGASRLVSGTATPHVMLEEKISLFMEKEAALLFGSGYAANVGAIPAFAGKGDVILADRLNHASLVDGCLLSRAEFKRYPHLDMRALEKFLVRYRAAKSRWIVTDGLFSMDGDLAPLREICGLAKKYSAYVYLDDAHAFGIYGANGRGTAEHFGVEEKMDVTMGTLGKAAGGFGAFISGSKTMIDYLLNKARSFVYSTAMPAANGLGALKAVEILNDFHRQRQLFWDTVKNFHAKLKSAGFGMSQKSYIIPLVMNGADRALEASCYFQENGVYIHAIRPPTVPEGYSRLRMTLSLNQRLEDQKKVIGLICRKKEIFYPRRDDGKK
ncbi:MAG: 8-amino-7-oxononanoate synthase [bacterium]|nr:MAG: 8-amino-7-oxononanoate synthase [bacterium]